MTDKTIKNNESKELSPRIETMTEADIETVMKIESNSFDYPWSKKRSFMQYIRQGNAFVVRAPNGIVGYVLMKYKDDDFELDKMAIASKYRRKGFGRSITDWAKKFAKDQSASRLFLHVRKSNHNAIEFYKSNGFEFIKEIPDHYKISGSNRKDKVALEFQWICS
jgi:ribosomal-protein-alanine N-acetyltransferase